MNNISLAKIGILAFIALGSINPGFAEDEYPADLAKKHPAAFHAFQKIVLPKYSKSNWVYRLYGTASPSQIVTFQGKKFVYGDVCKPHDCGGNSLRFLAAVDGSAAYALLNSQVLSQGKEVFMGKPDEAAKKILANGPQ